MCTIKEHLTRLWLMFSTMSLKYRWFKILCYFLCLISNGSILHLLNFRVTSNNILKLRIFIFLLFRIDFEELTTIHCSFPGKQFQAQTRLTSNNSWESRISFEFTLNTFIYISKQKYSLIFVKYMWNFSRVTLIIIINVLGALLSTKKFWKSD